jgi:hypothetical protein
LDARFTHYPDLKFISGHRFAGTLTTYWCNT